ncbi:hypothetical protein IU470_29860 [Nocardia abscessus]|uniref:XRE family transcriptional regulator n=1 Tax=Nocardia abscessus TaxID=120957 RepID=A0ABS0CG11_9NOCA|nr:hypothetical protein [Nocardia abscessus]MBF6229283.1 hypothetical protein [Nocardia abscessus]
MAGQADRTRLEQLVKAKRLTTSEFVRVFQRTSAEIAEQTHGPAAAVSWSTARRWIKGEIGLPTPISCRVLEQMFKEYGVTAEVMFGPPLADWTPSTPVQVPPQELVAPGRPAPGIREDIEEMTTMAAAESAAFGEFAEQSNVGPHTLEQFHADLQRIVNVYPNRPVYPAFVELRSLRDRVFRKLEGRQPPKLTRDLYLVAGTVCAVLANASFDLGSIDAAQTQARAAFLCGELAQHNGLRGWVRGLQALIAYWDDRFTDAVNFAEQGWQFAPEAGTARVRLASVEARARARMRDASGTEEALARANWAREHVQGEDQPGGMMAFPIGKQAYSAANAHLWLGGDRNYAIAETLADESLQLYLEDPPEQRRLGEMSLARLDLAVARLLQRDLDGAAEQIEAVLETGGQRRVESVGRRLRQISTALERPHFQTSALAVGLRDRIKDSPVSSAQALPPGATS